ncbi:MAG: rRNA (uridine2552-2-O)-methyltransferase [Desulfonauticus sp.]|nr:rRNA (uridine2552-2-O)-methyltransferase [Desulfonauticus sp.]
MKTYQDYYFKKAKKEKYPARSVYKLQEIDKKFRLFKKGQKVLDLGACPGSWTLWASQKVGEKGLVVAVDLNPLSIELPGWVQVFTCDATSPSEELQETLEKEGPFDLVISDMAPKTTGIKFADQARSYELALTALEVALNWLKKGGCFIVKIFAGPDVPEFLKETRKHFKSVKQVKPKSSRAESKEFFVVGLEKK